MTDATPEMIAMAREIAGEIAPFNDTAVGCAVASIVEKAALAAIQATTEKLQSLLRDPNAVHVNMLRGGIGGGIARPSVAQIIHIYGEDAIRAALTPALSGDAGEGELQAALAKRTSMSTIAGGGQRPHVEIRFAALADAHALTDAILNRSNEEDDHGPHP